MTGAQKHRTDHSRLAETQVGIFFFFSFFTSLKETEKVPPTGDASGRRLFLTFLQVLRQGRNFALLPRISLSTGE